MPIKIIRDDQTEEVPMEDTTPPPRILIESSDVPEDQARFSEPNKADAEPNRAGGEPKVAPPSGKSPAQTTWLIATGQCTLTTLRFSIAFRLDIML